MPVNKVRSDQYCIRQPNTIDVFSILKDPLNILAKQNIKIILTVSPIPIHTTFSGVDCLVANEYFKATLRSEAQLRAEESPHIDYFPSYEIGRSLNFNARHSDNIHIKRKIYRKNIGLHNQCLWLPH